MVLFELDRLRGLVVVLVVVPDFVDRGMPVLMGVSMWPLDGAPLELLMDSDSISAFCFFSISRIRMFRAS